MLKYIVILVVGFAFCSCIRDVDVTLPEKEKAISLNCLLFPGKDTIVAQVAYSRKLLSTERFKAVNNATVSLFENDSIAGNFIPSDTTSWILPYCVCPGKKYKIEVNTGDRKVWGEAIVPGHINGKISAQSNNWLTLITTIVDNRKNDTYYWITATNQNHLKAEDLYCNCIFADDFNRVQDTDRGYQYYYEDYIRIYNQDMPVCDSVKLHFITGNSYHSPTVFLFSVDYNLDKYMKSSLLLNDNDLDADFSPIVYSSFPTYSNIHGGVGIVGAYNCISKSFKKE